MKCKVKSQTQAPNYEVVESRRQSAFNYFVVGEILSQFSPRILIRGYSH